MPQMSDDPNAEAALLCRLRNRDSDAFEIVVRQHTPRMLATARRLLRGEADGEDAVQEAFALAFQRIEQFAGESQLGTWLHRILINACLMKLRTRTRHPEISIEVLLPEFNRFGHYIKNVRNWNLPPDEEVLNDESRGLVRQCIDKLPEDFRTVLLLRDIDELTTEETAQILQITAGAVKVRLHRARQALRTLLEPHFDK